MAKFSSSALCESSQSVHCLSFASRYLAFVPFEYHVCEFVFDGFLPVPSLCA